MILKASFKSFFLLDFTIEVLIYQGTTCHVFLLEMESNVKMKQGFKHFGGVDFFFLYPEVKYICVYVFA